MRFETVFVLLSGSAVAVAAVAAWASGASWRDITGLGEDPEPDTEEWFQVALRAWDGTSWVDAGGALTAEAEAALARGDP